MDSFGDERCCQANGVVSVCTARKYRYGNGGRCRRLCRSAGVSSFCVTVLLNAMISEEAHGNQAESQRYRSVGTEDFQNTSMLFSVHVSRAREKSRDSSHRSNIRPC